VRALHHLNWTPGIGDPTIGGWVTAALYFLAMISCWMTAIDRSVEERWFWTPISAAFLCLGINKQLDLQTALTEMGRVLAIDEGWYEQRQTVQVIFIIFVAIICAVAVSVLLVWARHASASTRIAILGTISVIGYVLIRAASFHHIDKFIGSSILGFRWNWIFEMGGIITVLFASEWRRRGNHRCQHCVINLTGAKQTSSAVVDHSTDV